VFYNREFYYALQPSTNLFLTFEILVKKKDLNKQTHLIYEDLVYLEKVLSRTYIHNKQILHKIFAYVTARIIIPPLNEQSSSLIDNLNPKQLEVVFSIKLTML